MNDISKKICQKIAVTFPEIELDIDEFNEIVDWIRIQWRGKNAVIECNKIRGIGISLSTSIDYFGGGGHDFAFAGEEEAIEKIIEILTSEK